jgi:hypothetical protein
MQRLSNKDRQRLRDLARQLCEIAHGEAMIKTRELWNSHSACRGERPMIRIELDTFASEIISPLQECEDEHARKLEWQLLSQYVNPVLFGDDSIMRDYFAVKTVTFFKAFDIDVQIEYANDGIGHHFVPSIKDLESDYHKIKPSTFGIDKSATNAHIEFINDIIGDIMPARLTGSSMYAVPTQDIVHIMSMVDIYTAMVECPDLFIKMMDGLADDYVAYFNYLSKQGVLLPTIGDEELGQGTYCFTNELPDKILADELLTSKSIWGFADSQETVGISETMFRELVFPAYSKITQQYGLLSYGCCEPVHRIWDSCLSHLPNLRKISISPWCDEEFMGERLSSTNIIYHRKPDATFLGVGSVLDEDSFRANIRKTLDCAKDCTIEFTQRDVYTVNHDVSKVKRCVEIIKEECMK